MSSLWSLDVDGLIVFERWVVFLGFLSGILGWFLGLLLIDLAGLDRVCWLLFRRHVLSSVQLEHYNFLCSSSWFRTSILAKFIWNQTQLLCYLVKALVTQSCPTLCDPMDFSLWGSSIYRILQVRILEFPFSRLMSWPRDQTWGLPHCRQIL